MHGWAGERQIGQNLEEIDYKHVERYKYASKYCENKKVLDIACGCGYGSNIVSIVANSVLGLDYSKEAVDYANVNWQSDNIVFKVFNFDSESINLLDKYDVIASFETIEHLKTKPVDTLKKFFSLLNAGGYLVLSHPENERGGHAFHLHGGIKGSDLVESGINIGFSEVVDEWHQSGGWDGSGFHIIVLKK